MNLRRLVAMAALGAILGIFDDQAARGAGRADEAASKSDDKDSIEIRFARAHLRMAELTLQKAQDMNRKSPGTLSSDLISQFADDVDVAKVELQTAQKSAGLDQFHAGLRRAELMVRVAEKKLKRANEANRISPGTINALDIERFRLGVELAQLRLERGKQLVDAAPDSKLAWQIDLINDAVSRLQSRSSLIVQNRLDF